MQINEINQGKAHRKQINCKKAEFDGAKSLK